MAQLVNRKQLQLIGTLHSKVQIDWSHNAIPSLLSLQVKPDLQALAQTLGPEALQYLYLGIHIGRSLSQIDKHGPQKLPLMVLC